MKLFIEKKNMAIILVLFIVLVSIWYYKSLRSVEVEIPTASSAGNKYECNF